MTKQTFLLLLTTEHAQISNAAICALSSLISALAGIGKKGGKRMMDRAHTAAFC